MIAVITVEGTHCFVRCSCLYQEYLVHHILLLLQDHLQKVYHSILDLTNTFHLVNCPVNICIQSFSSFCDPCFHLESISFKGE